MMSPPTRRNRAFGERRNTPSLRFRKINSLPDFRKPSARAWGLGSV
jgi:hypothetical protein